MGEFVKMAEKLNIQNYLYFYILVTNNQKNNQQNQNNLQKNEKCKICSKNYKKEKSQPLNRILKTLKKAYTHGKIYHVNNLKDSKL